MSPKQESAIEAQKMASSPEEPPKPQIPNSKYTKRVILKTLLERSDGGLSLVGERVVIGGWVKSSKEIKKVPPIAPTHEIRPESGRKDLTCNEILQTRVPILRAFMKILGMSSSSRSVKKEKEKEKEKDVDSPIEQRVESTVFLIVNDGSCVPTLQVVVESSLAPPARIMLGGTCILVEGVIQRASSPGKHAIELKAENVLHLGVVEEHEKYPLSKKRIPLQTLRNWAHIRPRTTTVASITKIRHALTHATHNFFQNNGFLYVQVPLITTTDTEGCSNKFHVTTLLNKMMKESSTYASGSNDATSNVSLDSIKGSIKQKTERVDELKRTDSNREALVAAIQDLNITKELVSHMEEKSKAATSIKLDKLNFSDDYFSCQTFLTVSGRLHLESYACALGNVYSFGPRFKTETSQSTRHVSEMWMVEAEMAFAELEEAMSCATDLLKHLCKWVMEHCTEDMKFVLKRVDQSIVARLQSVVSSEFEKIPYCKAIDILKQVKEDKFELRSDWGIPLTEEHESYLADEIYKKPVIIYDYPKEVEPFYVRQNDDGKTVSAFDIIVPKVGAVLRGSQNEERIRPLTARMKELGLSSEQYEWYLDLRRYGTVKHAGFSMEFDLMVLLATGITDVRDVIPFPRSFGKAYN